MDVFLKFKTGDELEISLDQEVIILGRASDCDIVLNSPNISRKHLQIKQVENEMFIKDISSSNWVSYNGDKLSKEEETEYFDFVELVLPDEIVVKAKYDIQTDPEPEPDPEVDIKPIRKSSPGRSARNRSQYNAKKRKSAKRVAYSEDHSFRYKLIISLTVMLGAVIYFIYNKKTVSSRDKLKKQVVKSRIKPEEKFKKYENQKLGKIRTSKNLDEYAKSASGREKRSLCFDKNSLLMCRKFFAEKRWRSGEGLYLSGESMSVTINESRFDLDGVKPENKIFNIQIHLLLKILKKDFLKYLKSSGVRDIYFKILDEDQSAMAAIHITKVHKLFIRGISYKIYKEDFLEYGIYDRLESKYGDFVFAKKLP